MITPVEEVISTLTDLVREGKIRYYGLSDTPAWYFTRAQTLAEKGGLERCATLQLEYSLAERNIEREHIPAAQELGIGLCPWSPLAGGLLTGKYKREAAAGKGEGRLTMPNPIFNKFTEHNWRVLDVLIDVAKQDRQDARAGRDELARHAARRHLGHSGRDENRAARRQSRLARFFDSRGICASGSTKSARPSPSTPTTSTSPVMQSRLSGGTTVREWRRGYLYDGAVAPPPEKKASAS